MCEREIYPGSPLTLVAAEVRHPTAPQLSESDKVALKALLKHVCPLTKPAQRVTLGMDPSGTSTTVISDTRFMSRDHTASVTFRDDAIVLETTRYERRSAFRALVREAVLARQEVAPVDGVERLGIRYVNEIRVPDLESPAGWDRWIAPTLTGPAGMRAVAGLSVRGWQGVAVLGTHNPGVVVRHGVFEGYAVNPAGDLQRPTPPPGPFFLIDMDCFWMPDGETPPLDWNVIETRYDEASAAACGVFEQLITDNLRSEVLRRDA